ncbi:MAG: hypothetical protein JWO14_1812 [Solirubrobacterales bacterium]|nr:hypothetical protein [Solirubrobacterales bacterium]
MKGRPDCANFRRFFLPLLLSVLLLALPASAMAAEGETGSIAGTVSAEDGKPIGEMEVCARAVDESSYECVPLPDGGPYVVPNLPEGKYQVGFWPIGNFVTQFWHNAPTWNQAEPLSVTGGETRGGVDATLVPGATIRGIVAASATGLPVGEVEACATSGEIERCARSDAAGEYVIDGLAGGVWNLYFYAQDAVVDVVSEAYSGGAFEVFSGEDKTVNAALGPGGQIAGTVRLAATGAPLGGVQVCVTMAASPIPLGCVHTPSSGAYRFMRVWPGSYKVVFSPEPSGTEGPNSFPTQWWGGQSTFASAALIEITPPAIVNNIDASLTALPAPATPIPPPVAKKPLKCKRNFVKRKVHGKQRCVKRHKAKPKPRHGRHKAKHQAPQSRPKRP